MQERGFGGGPDKGAERRGAFQPPGMLDSRAALARGVGVLWRGFDVQNISRWWTGQIQDESIPGDKHTVFTDLDSTNLNNPALLERIAVRTFERPEWRHFDEDYLTFVTVHPNRKKKNGQWVPQPRGVSRTELTHAPVGGALEGSEYFYRWSTWFEERDSEGKIAFPIGDGIGGVWQVFTQWHQASNTGSPPFQFSVKRRRDGSPYIGLEFGVQPAVWTTPFHYNVWHNFIVYVKYSNRGHGQVGLWYSIYSELPQQVGPFWSVNTTAATGRNSKPYLKQGLYRSANYYGLRYSRVVHSGITEGSTLESVWPRVT